MEQNPFFYQAKNGGAQHLFFLAQNMRHFLGHFLEKTNICHVRFFLTAPNHEGSEEQFREMAKKIAHQISTFSLEHSHFSDP